MDLCEHNYLMAIAGASVIELNAVDALVINTELCVCKHLFKYSDWQYSDWQFWVRIFLQLYSLFSALADTQF
jgi:hypothetical protein